MHHVRTHGRRDRRRSLESLSPAGRVTLEEIREALADEGYSGDQRKERLKTLLTELSNGRANLPASDRAELVKEIESVIDEHQDNPPQSDDQL